MNPIRAIIKLIFTAGILVSTGLILTVQVEAADYWYDDLTGTAGQQPIGWRDDTDTAGFNAEISFAATVSRATVTRTSSGTWGKVLSPIQSVNTAAFPLLGVSVTRVTPGAYWKIGIQEEEGGYAFKEMHAGAQGTGVFFFDYATQMGWTAGSHLFSVQVTIEGVAGDSVEVDFVRISDALSTSDAWNDDFSDPIGNTPAGWTGQTAAPSGNSFNAYITNSSSGWAEVIVLGNPSQSWGKVLSPRVPILVDEFPLIGIDVRGLSFGAAWRIAIQEQEGQYRYFDLRPSRRSVTWDGRFVFDYRAATGWTSGVHTFSIELVAEGGEDRSFAVNSIKIYRDTAVVPVPQATPFADEFDRPGTPPSGWTYYPLTTTPNVQMQALGGFADLTVVGASGVVEGGALSITMTVDTSAYPELWAWVYNLSPRSGAYNFVLHTETVGNFPLYLSGQNTTGIKKINYVNVIGQDTPGWGGIQTFALESKISGTQGDFVTLDYIRFQPPAATPTITPTPVTNTLRPSANLFRPDQGPLTLDYRVQSTDTIRITVFNTAGRKVRTLLEQHTSGQVSGTVAWDGRNEAGDWVGSGVYVIRIESQDLQNHTRFFKNVRVAVVR